MQWAGRVRKDGVVYFLLTKQKNSQLGSTSRFAKAEEYANFLPLPPLRSPTNLVHLRLCRVKTPNRLAIRGIVLEVLEF